jgi:hypothetical protein
MLNKRLPITGMNSIYRWNTLRIRSRVNYTYLEFIIGLGVAKNTALKKRGMAP